MNKYRYNYDIAVIGGGPAGIACAITAARLGKRVIIIEKNGYLGGNLTLGLPLLGFLDENGKQCIAGFAEELAQRLRKRGAAYEHRVCPKHNSVTNINPEQAKLLVLQMCREAGVDVLLHLELHDVVVNDGRIEQITAYGKCNEVTVIADIFVDCTGDGDLAYLSGCTCNKGRNGELMPPTVMFTLQNVDDSKLFDYVAEHPDEMLPSCDTVDHRPGYDAEYFRADPNYVFVGMTQLFSRLASEGKLPVERGNMIIINGLNKGEVYVNTTRLLHVDGTDVLDLTRGEIEGHLQVRDLVETFRTYVPGFENCYVSSIAPFIGIRETRRVLGCKTVTVEDALNGYVPNDTVCLSGYKIDIHMDCHGDTVFKTVRKPFGIPYASLVSAQISNLMIAGRCASVDEQVVGSTRIMPCCMAMGQACGIGASFALERNQTPIDVSVDDVRAELLKQNAILE